jgi:hypothetical protein
MTMQTIRIIVIGGFDTGKTSFIRSLGATSMGGSTSDASSSNEKSVIFRSGDEEIKFIFVELPSEKFQTSFLEGSTRLPDDFNAGQGVAIMFSYADHTSREPCSYWLNFLSSMNQDGKTPPIVVVGNKTDLKEDQGPPALFASEFSCGGLIDTDSSVLSSGDLKHSPMRVLVYFAKKIWSKKNFDYLVPSASLAPSVGILTPTEGSRQMLKPIVLYKCIRTGLGRFDVHTGYTATNKANALLKSISRKHIEIVYNHNGTALVTRLSECPVAILNANGQCIEILRTKNREAVVPVNGSINLNHGVNDEVTYKIGSFDSFMSGLDGSASPRISVESLLHSLNEAYTMHTKLLEAELVRISSPSPQQVESLQLTVADSALDGTIAEDFLQLSVIEDDGSEGTADDIYAGQTQAY